MKELYILDASGYIYRSYFAIRNITNTKGESTNALFGFIRSVQKLQKDFHPKYLIAVFDGPRSGHHRSKLYSDYKAHRKATPPDLGYQIEWSKQACELLGIPYLCLNDVEADDTMGAAAVWAEKQGFKTFLCTSDKDLYQLVNDNINILNTFKENQILGPKGVVEAFGVQPNQMIDYLAMIGDASDNVPGIPGIGPKTAAALLNACGTLEYILKHPECAGKKEESIRQHIEQAKLSRQLVTIHLDIEVPVEDDFYKVKPTNFEALKQFYASKDFNSLIRELEQQHAGQAEVIQTISQEPVSYKLVNSVEELKNLVENLSKQTEVAISTLGSHEQPLKAEIIGIAFSAAAHAAYFVPFNGDISQKELTDALKELFEHSKVQFYGHNIKYDFQLLANIGIKMRHISFDTNLASYLLNSHTRQHSLENVMLNLFGKVKPPLTDLIGKGKKALSPAQVSPELMCAFVGEAADYTFRIKQIFYKQLKERNLLALLQEMELPLLFVLAQMERYGIYVDLPYLHQMSQEVQKEISLLAQEIYHLAGEEFNINSPKQLSEILFTKMGIKPPKKTATGLSTSAEVLESLSKNYPIADKIQAYRLLEKLRSTYLDALPLEVNNETHRIHCTFNQTVAATGRLSCQDPNLQNIPIRSEIGRKIRGAFKPQKPGWSYLAADYSQIELRLLAHFSEDPNLIKAFQHGEDIHAHTASVIMNIPLDQVTKDLRYRAKGVNFGVIYGQQAFGLSQQLGIEVKEAAFFIDAYFKLYKRVKEYVEESKEKARQTGKSVTYTGRERLIPEIHSKNSHLRAAAERLAINTPLQGTAADLIKMAMLNVDQKIRQVGSKGYMLLQIHDELIFEFPDEEISDMSEVIRSTMQEVLSLKVPLIVDIMVGKNWAQC